MCFFKTHSKKEWKRLQLKERYHNEHWDLLNQVSLERWDKTEKTKQLQAILALLKLAQLFEVANHYTQRICHCNQLRNLNAPKSYE